MTAVSSAALPKFGRSVSMLAWGYNEEESLEGFFDRAFALLDATVDDFEVVFINDGSADRTGAIADAYAAREPRLRVVHNERNLNVGISSWRAIQAARNEILFWQTVDWSYDIRHLRIFLELTRHFDVVQGVRPVPIRLLSYIPVLRSVYRVRSRSDSLRQAIVSLANYYIIRILFGVRFHDMQNVTFYPTEIAQSLNLQSTTSFANPEGLIKAKARGLRFLEVPIGFLPREVGESKGGRIDFIIRSAIDVVRHWLKWGWRLRMENATQIAQTIHRVAEPVFLDEDVIHLAAPLFKEFR
jgi:glycosyltransferase involved in cell wall biosynthesis